MRLCPVCEPTGVLPKSIARTPAADRPRPEVCAWRPAHACMHAQPRKAMACLLQEGDGAAGPPLQDCLPLVHGQLRKGLHGGAHEQQHPWGRHGRCARARSQEEQQPAGQQHGVKALRTCFTESFGSRPAWASPPSAAAMAGPIFWGRLHVPWATACVRLPAGHPLCSAEAAVTIAQEASQ